MSLIYWNDGIEHHPAALTICWGHKIDVSKNFSPPFNSVVCQIYRTKLGVNWSRDRFQITVFDKGIQKEEMFNGSLDETKARAEQLYAELLAEKLINA